jgi:predicted component of viral defense system (DUF524 family)
MASLPTGSRKLVTLETGEITLVIKDRGISVAPLVSKDEKESEIYIDGGHIEKISISGEDSIDCSSEEDGWKVFRIPVKPMFFEQTDYVILIRSKKNESLHVGGSSSEIYGRITAEYEDDATHLEGIINFENNVGFYTLRVYNEHSLLLSLRIEVYPSKISYKKDYQAIMQDIDRMVSDCVLDFMKKTYHEFNPSHEKCETPAVFYAVLKTIYDPFLDAVRRILSSPHHKLITMHEVVPSYKAKRVDRKTEKWMMQHAESVRLEKRKVFAEKVLSSRKIVTYDTTENQLVKFMLNQIIRKTKDFAARSMRACPDKEKVEITNNTGRIINELSRILNTTFLREVSDYQAMKSMSLVFEMAPGYRELYKYYLMLLNGISVGGDLFEMSERETAVLYEYWCFIKLYEILKDQKYQLKSPDVIKVDRKGVTVDLARGKQSMVVFSDEKTGEIIELSYNPTESATQTVDQRPDNVLSLTKKGSKTKYRYVFDAKYRIETNDKYSTPENPGPKTDDINTMHRYRDAIVCENAESRFTFEKTMFGAYILFPYPFEEEKYMEHAFYKSIDRVNIGGLPFLPSATKLVTETLNALISERPETAYERASMPAGIDELLKEHNWKKSEVLIGRVVDLIELEKVLNDVKYHIDNYTGGEKHYIVLWCEKDKQIRYYGRVSGSISDHTGVLSGDLEKRVIRRTFYVESWERFKEPIFAEKSQLENLKQYGFNEFANPERHMRLRLQKYLDEMKKT